MTPQEAAKKFLLEMFDIDTFEYMELVEWMQDEEGLDPEVNFAALQDTWKALADEIDVMLQRHAEEDR